MKHPIVFYDGECGLCDSFVHFMLGIDKKRVLRFAALQGKTAKKELPKKYTKDLNTFVLKDKEKIFTSSTAVLRTLYLIGGKWRLMVVGRVIPHFIRDKIYEFVSRNRHIISEKKCKVPSAHQRNLFLH